MPNTKCAIKALRRDKKARERNRSQRRTMKTAITSFKLALSKDNTLTEASFAKMQSLVARAGRKNLIPSGRANRIISRMSIKKREFSTIEQV